MTKATFNEGDIIGKFVIDEFGGTDPKGESLWWVTENDQPKLIKENTLRGELAKADWSPTKIRALSAKAYTELCQELGDETINEIMGTSGKKSDAPLIAAQREIATKWFQWHPQIPVTKKNTDLFDEALAELPNPTFTSADFDLVFTEKIFEKLQLNPTRAGISGFGEAITGETAIQKFTAAQLQRLQQAFPVKTSVDFNKLSKDEILKEVAKTTTADGFLAYTKEVDKEKGIEQPVSPLVRADWERAWSNFFQLHLDLSPTDEIKAKLLEVLTKNQWPVQTQYLEMALDSLLKAGDKNVTTQESSTYQYGRARLVVNEPRPKIPVPTFDPTVPVSVSIEEINKMDAKTYATKILNPQFRKAVDELYVRIGSPQN